MEDIGELYLGEDLDLSSGEDRGERLLFGRDDLTTHGVIVGMTGSGKTGAAIVLLEEALASGIPALILDPKGDMPNLLLNFPNFAPGDFEPWVNDGDARNAGMTTPAFAAQQAELWQHGLSRAGITPEAMRALTSSVEFGVFTPGSTAGRPLNIIGDLRAPATPDAESIREEAAALVGGLLSLIGINADPLASREHILLANILETAWASGRDMDLASVIGDVMEPPFRKLGVFEVDTFFPPADRRSLAMRLNGLVASPSFAAWTEGTPLDVGALLFTPGGRPRASILYLAHLSDAERQFVVSLVMARVITWMRTQSGTNNLRALVYMDEVAGFAPPTAEPPAKRPIMTMLKQARAYGVGLVLATQNPVDLDYKAMSNAGMWMVGRLQTARDKARVLEALTSAAGEVDIPAIDAAISGLGRRQFILHNTHARGGPRRFSTRWAMSYLRGPLTRQQLGMLPNLSTEATPASNVANPAAPTSAVPATAPSTSTATASLASSTTQEAVADDESLIPPVVASGVPVHFVDPAAPWAAEFGATPGGRRMRPVIAARIHLRFSETRAAIDHREEWEAILPLDGPVNVEEARQVDFDARDFRTQPPDGAVYRLPTAKVNTATFFREVERDLKASLRRRQSLEIFTNRQLKLFSRIGETQEEFAARCQEAGRAEADREAATLSKTFETKMARVRTAIARAEDRVEQYQADTKTRKSQEMVAGVGDLLGAFLGGKATAGSIATRLGRSARGASSRRGVTTRTQQRLEGARSEVERREDELKELELDLQDDLADLVEKWDDVAAQVEPVEITLKATDLEVDELALAWIATA